MDLVWTEVNDLNTARRNGGGAGSSNSNGLVFGGTIFPPSGLTARTEFWDGSSWTEVNDLAAGRRH